MPAENTPPALPPTPTRIQLAKDIKAGLVKCWHFIGGPEVRRTYDDRLVSDGVRTFIARRLADLGTPGSASEASIVSLTPAGEEWLNRYGSTE